MLGRPSVSSYWPEFMLTSEEMRPALASAYGQRHAQKVQYAETFQIADHGRPPSEEELSRPLPLFEGE